MAAYPHILRSPLLPLNLLHGIGYDSLSLAVYPSFLMYYWIPIAAGGTD
jgi:hypothetical protein